jgi:hypothetical protein
MNNETFAVSTDSICAGTADHLLVPLVAAGAPSACLRHLWSVSRDRLPVCYQVCQGENMAEEMRRHMSVINHQPCPCWALFVAGVTHANMVVQISECTCLHGLTTGDPHLE